MGVVDPKGRGVLWREQNALRPNRQSYAATWRIQTRSWVDLPQRFRVLPNYFGPCCYHYALQCTLSVRLRGEAVESCGPMSRVAFCCPIDLVMTMWLMVSSALARSYDDRCDAERLDIALESKQNNLTTSN